MALVLVRDDIDYSDDDGVLMMLVMMTCAVLGHPRENTEVHLRRPVALHHADQLGHHLPFTGSSTTNRCSCVYVRVHI